MKSLLRRVALALAFTLGTALLAPQAAPRVAAAIVQVNVWPALGTTVTLQDGITTITSSGAVVTYTSEIASLLSSGALLTYDPTPGSSSIVDYPTASIDSGAPLSVVTLAARSGTYQGQVAAAQYYDTGKPAGGGLFRWDGAATSDVDNCTIFGNASVGRWIRLYDGPIDVRWCGAIGDGSTPDNDAFQDGLDAAAGGTLEIPYTANGYAITDTLTVSANTTIRGKGGTVIMSLASNHATGKLFSVTTSGVTFDNVRITGNGSSSTTGNKYAIIFEGSSGTRLTKNVVRNCRFTSLAWADVPGVLSTHAVFFKYSDGQIVSDNFFSAVSGAAVFASISDDVQISRNRIDDTGWYSIQLQAKVRGADIDGNIITGTVSGHRDWGGSINLMSAGSSTSGCTIKNCRNENVRIRGNYISGTHSYNAGIYIQSSSKVLVDGNTIEEYQETTGAAGVVGNVGNYIRATTRPEGGASPTNDEDPCSDLTIVNNVFRANNATSNAIYIDNQRYGAQVGTAKNLIIAHNILTSVDSTDHFNHCIAVHGGTSGGSGWENVQITGNRCSGFPGDSTPVNGLIGVYGRNATYPTSYVRISGNLVSLVGGTSSASAHTGITVGEYAKYVSVNDNYVTDGWFNYRTLANGDASARVGVQFGVNGSAGAVSIDALHSAAPNADSILSGSNGSCDPPNLELNDGYSSCTVTVSGAAVGDYVEDVSFSNDLQGVSLEGWVSATNTVTVRFRNQSANLITANASYNPANLLSLTSVTSTITVTGAELGDLVLASFDQDLLGVTFTAGVSAADTVKFTFFNGDAGAAHDVASGNVKVVIRKLSNAINLSSGTVRARVRKAA